MFRARASEEARTRSFAIILGGASAIASLAAAPAATPHAKAKLASQAQARATAAAHAFQLFIEDLWPEKAQARGVSRQTFDLAFRGVTYDPKVSSPIPAPRPNSSSRYGSISRLGGLAQSHRGARRAAAKSNINPGSPKAQRKFGVDRARGDRHLGTWRPILAAFAGASDNVIRALATLAYAHYAAAIISGMSC